MNTRTLSLFICLNLFTASAYGGVVWVDWSTGASQPFSSSAGTGTVSYTDSFQSVVPGSVTPPDINFPFGNPINLLNVFQSGNASITFTFSGVSPDDQTIFTLGNLRPTNRFVISAYDNSNAPISLTAWTNLGQYRIYPDDTGQNLWDPSTGELVGNGNLLAQENSKNLFLGLTMSRTGLYCTTLRRVVCTSPRLTVCTSRAGRYVPAAPDGMYQPRLTMCTSRA